MVFGTVLGGFGCNGWLLTVLILHCVGATSGAILDDCNHLFLHIPVEAAFAAAFFHDGDGTVSCTL